MKRAALALIAIFVLLPFSPWWMLFIILGGLGWFSANSKNAMALGFGVAVASWGIKLGIGYLSGGAILLNRVAEMMHLGSSFGLIMVSLILAGILGVLSSSSGYQLRSIFSLSTSNTK